MSFYNIITVIIQRKGTLLPYLNSLLIYLQLMFYLQAFVTAKLLAVSMLSTWGTKLKGASDALGLVLWRKIANRKAVYSWSVFRMKRPPIKNSRKSPFSVSSCNYYYTRTKHCQIHGHSPLHTLRSKPCHILGDCPLSLKSMFSISVFRTAQVFTVPICHDHSGLWDRPFNLFCLLSLALPTIPSTLLQKPAPGISKMHKQKRQFALKYRNEGLWWHAGEREIRREIWTLFLCSSWTQPN